MIDYQGQRGRPKSKEPKKNPDASNSNACYYCKKSGHIKKNCMEYKEMLKKKGGEDSQRASTSGKSEQTGVVEEADENPCDVLTAQSGKRKYSNALLLNSRCTYHVSKKRSSTYTSLSMEAQS